MGDSAKLGNDDAESSRHQSKTALSPVAQSREANSRWEELVRGCAQADQSSLAELYDQSSPLVYGVALRILASVEDAEEVTIDVYNQVWRSAANFQNTRGSVTAWLVMLARSRAIDRIRSRATRARMEEPIFEQTELRSEGSNPEQSTEAGQRQRRIRSAMASLPEEQRRVVELAFFGGLSHSELADHLSLPLGTVKTRIRSSMMKLRELLVDYA